MKTEPVKRWILWVASATAMVAHCPAQGTFQNLDFEAARVIPLDKPYLIATTNALPGWTAFLGTDQQSSIHLNTGWAALGLNATNTAVIDGNFSVALVASPTEGLASISQTGLVPPGAKSLLFKVKPSGAVVFYPTNVVVSLGGQTVPCVGLPSPKPSRGFLYGADISRFAGQTETLSFSGGSFALDDIEFSPYNLTELPGPLALQTPRRTPDGHLVFDVVTAFAGQPTVIEASPDMTRWTRLSTNWPAGGIFTFTDAPPARVQRRFYRVIVELP